MNDAPRRNQLQLNTPAELAIFNAIQEVERAGADVVLTEVVDILIKAKQLLGDFVDYKLSESMKILGTNR